MARSNTSIEEQLKSVIGKPPLVKQVERIIEAGLAKGHDPASLREMIITVLIRLDQQEETARSLVGQGLRRQGVRFRESSPGRRRHPLIVKDTAHTCESALRHFKAHFGVSAKDEWLALANFLQAIRREIERRYGE